MSTVLEMLPRSGRCPSRRRPEPALELCRVASSETIAPGIHRLQFHSPSIAGSCVPGQFVHVSCGPAAKPGEPVLRRPFSISSFDRRRGLVEVVYRVVGPGTNWLSRLRRGDLLDVMGPLGSGFSHPSRRGPVLLVAGGIGVAPLLGWAQELLPTGRRMYALYGARTREQLVGVRQLETSGVTVTACTDDGSEGFHGSVCDLLNPVLSHRRPVKIYACGPTAVLRAAQSAARELRISCEVSVEDRLACGIGACVGCAVPRRAPSGGRLYFRACSDGPVFDAAEIVI